MTPTEHQSLEQIRFATGDRIRLQRWESIDAVAISDLCIMLTVDTYKVRVLVREDRYEAHGKRTRMWMRQSVDAGFYLMTDLTVWDDSFEQYSFQNFHGSDWVPTKEFPTDRHFTDACHRPGTETHPMDNYDRTRLDPDFSHDRMKRHWKV